MSSLNSDQIKEKINDHEKDKVKGCHIIQNSEKSLEINNKIIPDLDETAASLDITIEESADSRDFNELNISRSSPYKPLSRDKKDLKINNESIINNDKSPSPIKTINEEEIEENIENSLEIKNGKNNRNIQNDSKKEDLLISSESEIDEYDHEIRIEDEQLLTDQIEEDDHQINSNECDSDVDDRIQGLLTQEEEENIILDQVIQIYQQQSQCHQVIQSQSDSGINQSQENKNFQQQEDNSSITCIKEGFTQQEIYQAQQEAYGSIKAINKIKQNEESSLIDEDEINKSREDKCEENDSQQQQGHINDQIYNNSQNDDNLLAFDGYYQYQFSQEEIQERCDNSSSFNRKRTFIECSQVDNESNQDQDLIEIQISNEPNIQKKAKIQEDE